LWFRKKRWKCEILIVVGCPVLKKTLSYTRLILVLNARKIITQNWFEPNLAEMFIGW
jgi:hypothetical protein